MRKKVIFLTVFILSLIFLNSSISIAREPISSNPAHLDTPWDKIKAEAEKKLSNIKVASQYRYVTDGMRSIDEVINILKETRTDFIALGWGRISPIPEKCSDLSGGQQKICEKRGYSYEYLTDATAKIKSALPYIIFGGGLSVEFLNPQTWNELTWEKLGRDKTWEMALDPRK